MHPFILVILALTDGGLAQWRGFTKVRTSQTARYRQAFHSKKSEQASLSEKYCLGVKPDNDLKSLTKCDWS